MPSKEEGHRYSFGAPSKGWPTFGPDGKVVKEEPECPVLGTHHWTGCGYCAGCKAEDPDA